MAGGFLGVYPGADFEILPYAFVVVIVGGMGSLKGALVGSLMVGLLDNFGKALFPELSYFTLFAPMAAHPRHPADRPLRARVMRLAAGCAVVVAAVVARSCSPACRRSAVLSAHAAHPGR